MAEAHTHRARVLVVDDEAGLLRVAERILSARHDVRCAAQPAAALALAREFRPDLAICDVRMPEMDGFQLADALRREQPGLDVIFMTGSNAELSAHFVRAIRERAFYFVQKPFEREVLETLVDRCLELRRLRDAESRYVRRLVEELNEARLFQRSMLAPERAEIEGIQIRAACLPSAELGGDLYDYMPAARGRLALVIADVRGHGASAAFMTATVKAAFRGGGLHGFDPQWIVASLAGSLKALPPDRFVTAFIGLLDADSGWLRYVNAGHPPGVILCDGESPHLLHSTGPLVCSEFEAGSWSAAEVRLTPGARLLLFTDGLTDVSGAAGRYGIPRLVSRAASAAEDGDRLLADLLADVRAFGTDGPQEDDLTAMVVWRL